VVLPVAKIALAPLLLWQGRQVRRQALRLPEAAGARSGLAGSGALCLRLLIVGDSSAAGVGAVHQDEALAGRLSQALARRLQGAVHWQLIAKSGHTTVEAIEQFRNATLDAADVLVTAVGANDVVAQVSPRRWAQQMQLLHELAVQRAGVRYSLHSAVPPMHTFPLLPQPLRWLLGAHAMRMNRSLARSVLGQPQRGMQAFAPQLHGAAAAALMAPDGFHPGPPGYQVWADGLAERIAREWSRDAARAGLR
jgi:lysophospholipase L1-like esterase